MGRSWGLSAPSVPMPYRFQALALGHLGQELGPWPRQQSQGWASCRSRHLCLWGCKVPQSLPGRVEVLEGWPEPHHTPSWAHGQVTAAALGRES